VLNKTTARNFLAPSTLSSQRPHPSDFLSKSTLASFALFARDSALSRSSSWKKVQICLVKRRFFRLKCLTEPLQEIFSRQGAKRAKKKIFSYISKLGVLCVFARVIILQRFATDNFKYVWLVFTPESLNCSRFYHRSYSGQMLLNPILVKAIAIAPQGFFSCCS
jgi:hypothetical protein